MSPLRNKQQLAAFIAASSLLLRQRRGYNDDGVLPHPSTRLTSCEPSIRTPYQDGIAHEPSRFRRIVAATLWYPLPVPRRLLKNDPAFSDSRLRAGLRQRERDERRLKELAQEIQRLAHSDPQKVQSLFHKVSDIAYGNGVTPQAREDFLIRYGCTGWTEEVLDVLVNLAESRGFVEIGSGHGQWARALTEALADTVVDNSRSPNFEFVLAYDDKTDLPLNEKVYHKHTQPAHDYFYDRVQRCPKDIQDVFRPWSCRGRVLLLVFPPPGSMALETIRAYVGMCTENDTVVYVGEGREGATASNELFDYFEVNGWSLLKVMNVRTQPGDKGFEKLYILRRPPSKRQLDEDVDGVLRVQT